MANKRLRTVTQTAVMLALLAAMQFITRGFGQFVTGAAVNTVLLVSVLTVGLTGGLAVAVLSPFLAFFAGIGPAFIQIVPFMAAGNAILVAVAWKIDQHRAQEEAANPILSALGLCGAGVAKTVFLWVALVLIALPFIPGLNAQQTAVIGAAFTWPQMVTAAIASVLTTALMPLLRRVMR